MTGLDLRTFRALPDETGKVIIEELTDSWQPIVEVPTPPMATDAELAGAILAHTTPDAHHPQAHKSDHAESGSDPLDSVGDIHFTNGVYAGASDDHKGQNKTVIIPNVGTLTFKKGILTSFEPVIPP